MNVGKALLYLASILTIVILPAENLTSAVDVYVWWVIFSHTVKYLLN